MPSRVRTVLILLLTFGLLWFFLRNADMPRVWAEMRHARAPLLLAAVLVTGAHLRAAGAPLAVSPGADRPYPLQQRLPCHGYRVRRHIPAAGASRRGDPALPAGAPRRAAGDRRLRDDHPRAAPRPRDRAPALCVLRAHRRPGIDVRGAGGHGARQGGRPDRRGGRRRRAGRCLRRGRPSRAPRAAGRSASSGCCRRSWPGSSPRSSKRSPRAWP